MTDPFFLWSDSSYIALPYAILSCPFLLSGFCRLAQAHILSVRSGSGVIRVSCRLAGEKLCLSILLDQVNVLVAHPELALEIDARLVREGHAGLKQVFLIPFV